MRPGNIIVILAFTFPVFSRRRDVHGIQFSCNLGGCISVSRPFKYLPDNPCSVLVRLHTPVCALAVAIRTDNTLIFSPAHFRIFGAFRFHGHIPAVTFADKVLKGNVNPAGIAFEIGGVKIITDRDKPGVVEGKYPLNEISGFNAVTAKPGEVFYDNAVNLPGLDHRQKFLYRRALKIRTCVAVINKFQHFAVIPFRQRHGLFPEDQFLVGNTQTFSLKVLHGQTDIKGDHIFFVHGSTAFP